MTTIGSLFAGYGGLEMGAQAVWPDAKLAWYSEIDKGALKILRHHHPDVPNLGDVTAVDWSQVPAVDILTGGSPCQDLSHAGKRQGMTEGTRSNLWVAMREAIAQLRPRLVIWENVRGAYSAAADSELEPCAGCVGDGPGVHLRALGRVLGDLSDLGYVGGWHGLRAADVGAPHGRFRVFVVAYPASDTRRFSDRDGGAAADARRLAGEVPLAGRLTAVAQPASNGDPGRVGLALLPTPRCADGMHANLRPHAADTSRLEDAVAVHLLPTPAVNDMGEGKTVDHWDEWTAGMQAKHGNGNGHGKSLAIEAQRMLPTPRATHWAKTSDRAREEYGSSDSMQDVVDKGTWGDYAAAIVRWEAVLDRPAPPPTMTSTKGNPQLAPAFVEWMMGLPAGHVTDAPGITRNEALKALGNGVVPQQAEAAIQWLLARIAAPGAAA